MELSRVLLLRHYPYCKPETGIPSQIFFHWNQLVHIPDTKKKSYWANRVGVFCKEKMLDLTVLAFPWGK